MQQQQQQQATPQQQQQQMQQMARAVQQARANSQNGNNPQGGMHSGAQMAAFRQLQQNAQAAAQGQGGNLALSPQNIGMMNMAQAALAANMGQGALGQNGGPATPGQQARIQQALAMHNGNVQGGMGMSPHNMDSPNSVSGSNVMGSAQANIAYERIDSLSEEKRTEVFDKVIPRCTSNQRAHDRSLMSTASHRYDYRIP